ncbi:helix-turn-helix transcriptional regulator [Amycolatopsis sp. NPDC004079]|uniref:helix-turn-helix domain-containing protein n=1 Tax=Amycolatopsis sp. NPDC004079 TaxID=3154549 RepID=UPI0033AFF2E5
MNQPGNPTPTGRPRAVLLGAVLRFARENARFGVRELARRIGITPAIVSSWELGQRSPGPDYVASILGALGVTGNARHQILQIARTTDPDVVVLAQPHPSHQAALENFADSVIDWHLTLVPEPLQTLEYTRAVLMAAGHTSREAASVADARAEHRITFGPKTPPRVAYIGEAAFRRSVAPAAVAAHQFSSLNHLTAAAPAVSIRVVPTETTYHPGLAGSFTHYTMRNGLIAYLSHHGTGSFVSGNGPYSRVINQLDGIALSAAESRAVIEECIVKLSYEPPRSMR